MRTTCNQGTVNCTTLLIATLVFLTITTTPLMLSASGKSLAVTGLRVEYHKNPVGIDQASPRFFWKLQSADRNTMQTAYHIRVTTDPRFHDPLLVVWDSGEIQSDQSIQLAYAGTELMPATRYYWQVRVWDNHGNTSQWSDSAFFETGLPDAGKWQGEWITIPWDEKKYTSQPAPMFRNEFILNGAVSHARAYISSLGLYEMEINGRRVGCQVFTPGWTSFNHRLQYQVYDISELLQQGPNAIGVFLGDGWYRGNIGWGGQRNYYGEELALLAQLHVEYTDGRTEVFSTNGQWRTATGPIIWSDIYNGEYYDARLEKPGWTQPEYDDSQWQNAAIANHSKDLLIAPQAPPVKKIQELKPIDLFITPEGDTVIDMGQNMIGWIRLKVSGEQGRKITLRHAEVLDKNGNFYTENLRSAKQKNTYVLKGEGTEIWEPRFTFQGFRYVAIDGFPGDLTKDAFTGVVIHSDMEPTGHFDCAHPLVNRLQHNIIWGQKGNFLDVPTDCPQRDERMGWTGDIQVFANTANTYMNTASFLTRWLGDLQADQFENGAVPHVVPNVLGPHAGGAAGWGDAATVVPWTLYQHFGDKKILKQQYQSMKDWIAFIKERAGSSGDPYLWSGDPHFGDWLSFSTIERPDYPGAYTHTDLVATAYFARSAALCLETAIILGKQEDISYLAGLLENIKQSFQEEFVTPNGRLSSDTQTAYLLALSYDLLPEELRPRSAGYLYQDVTRHGHLTTGFLGTPHLNHILTGFGHTEQAYRLLMREEFPSWLYPVTMNATTIWERWDGIKPDGLFQTPGMNSFNHYAYGAIGEWLFRVVAGINNTSPAYKTILIQPSPGGGLSHARAIQHTLFGRVVSSWQFTDDAFIAEVEIPPNTTADTKLPYAALHEVKVNNVPITQSNEILGYSTENDQLTVHLGSGNYSFRYPSDRFPDSARPSEMDIFNGKLPTIRNKLAELLACARSRDILFGELPELMQSPWLSQVMGFSLERSVEVLPQELRASKETLDKIDSRLRMLNH